MLAELRKQCIDLTIKGEALQMAMKARREEAKELKKPLEVAALANRIIEARTLMDDLKAMDEAYKLIQGEFEAVKEGYQKTSASIVAFYQAALDGTGPKVDWSIKTIPGKLHDGWGGRYYDGQLVLIDTELCLSEVVTLQNLFKSQKQGYKLNGIVAKPESNGYHLQASRNVYRGTVWSDLRADTILDIISPLLVGNELHQEVSDLVKNLTVLAD